MLITIFLLLYGEQCFYRCCVTKIRLFAKIMEIISEKLPAEKYITTAYNSITLICIIRVYTSIVLHLDVHFLRSIVKESV